MKNIVMAVGLFVAATANAALAQERGRGPWFASIAGGAVYQGDAGAKDGAGEFSVTRGFVQPGIGYAFDRQNRALLSVGAGRTDYAFDDGLVLDGGEPWSGIRDLRVSAPVFFAPSERVSAIVIPGVRWNTELGADLDEGRTEGVLAGASYKFGDSLSLGPGVGWFSKLGGGTTVFPILLIDWNITDTLNLSTGRGLAASQGPGLMLSYKLSDSIRLGLSGRYEESRFRLDGNGSVAGGVGEDSSFPLIVSVAYQPNPAASVSAFVGAEFGGKLRVRDASGTTLDETGYETAPVLGAAFRFRF